VKSKAQQVSTSVTWRWFGHPDSRPGTGSCWGCPVPSPSPALPSSIKRTVLSAGTRTTTPTSIREGSSRNRVQCERPRLLLSSVVCFGGRSQSVNRMLDSPLPFSRERSGGSERASERAARPPSLHRGPGHVHSTPGVLPYGSSFVRISSCRTVPCRAAPRRISSRRAKSQAPRQRPSATPMKPKCRLRKVLKRVEVSSP
jgi:hypothetical protein